MIHLCYMKRPKRNTETLRSDMVQLSERLTASDLIIFPNFSGNEFGGIFKCNVYEYDSIDIEKLASMELKNIVMINFRSATSTLQRSIINLKSKKTEIIGISWDSNSTFREYSLAISDLKETGMNDDSISILLILQKNFNPEASDQLIKNLDLTKCRYEEIESINDALKYLKH